MELIYNLSIDLYVVFRVLTILGCIVIGLILARCFKHKDWVMMIMVFIIAILYVLLVQITAIRIGA